MSILNDKYVILKITEMIMKIEYLLKDQINEAAQTMKAQLHYKEIQSCAAMKCLSFIIKRVNDNEPSLPEEALISLYKIGLSRIFISGVYTRFDVTTHQPIEANVPIDFELLKVLGYNFNEKKAHQYIEEEKKSMGIGSNTDNGPTN